MSQALHPRKDISKKIRHRALLARELAYLARLRAKNSNDKKTDLLLALTLKKRTMETPNLGP